MNYPVMRGDYLLMYEGRRKYDPDEIREDIRQAYCARCGKLYQIDRYQKTCPYFCPNCEEIRKLRAKQKREECDEQMKDNILLGVDLSIGLMETLLRTHKRPTKKRTKVEKQIREDLVKRIGEEEAEKYWPGIVQAAKARLEERPENERENNGRRKKTSK